jgi:8-oxo-dGTP pyrophosphatase MutT (NUDIX family)
MQILHVGAYGVLARDGRVLLIHKTRGPYAGRWDLPGGKLEHGESPEECLVREVHEETGVRARGFLFGGIHTGVIDFVGEEGPLSLHHLGLLYYIPHFEAEQRMQDSIDDMTHESEDNIRWLRISDLKEEELSPLAWKSLHTVR